MIHAIKRLYCLIGIHTAPRGTLVYAIHNGLNAVASFFRPPKPRRDADYAPLPPRVEHYKVGENSPYRLPVKRIAIVKGDHIGDLVMAIPAIDELKLAFPLASFTLICNKCNHALAVATGLFDEVVVAPLDTDARKGPDPEDRHQTIKIVEALETFDIAVDMKVEPGSRFALRFIKARIKAGFYSDTMPVTDEVIVLPIVQGFAGPERLQCSLHNRELLSVLANAIITRFKHEKSDPASSQLERMTKGASFTNLWNGHAGPIVGIHTGAGHETKCWPLGRYVLLCQELITSVNARIVLFGTSEQSADAKTIVTLCGDDKIKDMTGKLSLTEFISRIPELTCFIGHDTGTTHIAATLGCATLCLFSGITSRQRFAPIGDNVTVLYNSVPCSPCGLAKIAECPNDHACMMGITVGDVMKQILHILAAIKSGSATADTGNIVSYNRPNVSAPMTHSAE